MLPATNTTTRIARSQTREDEIFQLLTERRGEMLTATDIAATMGADVQNIRSALQRMHARRQIAKSHEIRTYYVGNSTCKHRAALWFMP